MATSRLLGLGLGLGISTNKLLSNNRAISSRPVTVMNKVGPSADNRGGGGVTVKAAGSSPALVLERETTEKGLDLGLLSHSHWGKFITKPSSWRFHIQMFIEKAILDCRFFTLLAISGSLLGSFRCFVEGCFMIVVSYVQYLHPLSKMSQQGQGHVDVVLQIIEAIDMFLMGTAMLVFAMALHAMFVGPSNLRPNSTLSRNINLKRLAEVECAMQAKSKMGHALIMILQIKVLDKCKSIAVSSGMDLACFAAAIFLSSASIFLLSRTNTNTNSKPKR